MPHSFPTRRASGLLQPGAALAGRLQRRRERLAFERAVDSDHAARGQLRAGACRQDQERPCGALRARRAQQLRLEADLFRCIRHGGKVTTCIGWTVAAARRLFHRLLTVSTLTRSEEGRSGEGLVRLCKSWWSRYN